MEKIKKLEPKHLCGYLPHGLKVKSDIGSIIEICGFDFIGMNVLNIVHKPTFLLQNVKPLLLPLSALTEPMEDGSVPIVELAKMLVNTDGYNFDEEFAKEWILQIKKTELPYFLVEYLYSKHFDIYGLIPDGLAIDKRTVKL